MSPQLVIVILLLILLVLILGGATLYYRMKAARQPPNQTQIRKHSNPIPSYTKAFPMNGSQPSVPTTVPYNPYPNPFSYDSYPFGSQAIGGQGETNPNPVI